MATATDELSLLERVFLRVGSAETDEQLQNAVSKFLPPVLLKLSSQQEGVRKKVMELLIHINKRIKTRPLVQLPVEALLLQYQDPAATSFVTNFTIIYIKLGYPRLPVAKQGELVPSILNSLEGKPQSHQDGLLLLLMPALGQVVRPNELGLADKRVVARQLLDICLDLLLLPYGFAPQEDPQGGAPKVPTPPGMHEQGFKRICGESKDGTLKAEEIEQTKLSIVKFLAGGALPDADILCHLVVAAADTRFSVANAADLELKKIIGVLDWSSAALVSPLYNLLVTTRMASKNKPAVDADRQRTPVNTRIKLKIMPYLCRARGPAIIFPDCIQVLFDALWGKQTNARLRTMAMQFAMVIIDGAKINNLQAIAGILSTGLLKLIADKEDTALKMLAYCAVGKLGHRLPNLVNKDLALLQTFFDALSSQEDNNTRMSVREALLGMVDAFKLDPAELEATRSDTSVVGAAENKFADDGPPANQTGSPPAKTSRTSTRSVASRGGGGKNSPPRSSQSRAGTSQQQQGGEDPGKRTSTQATLLQALLESQIESEEPMARFVAVRYAATVFPADHVPSRYLLLLASGDSKDEVFTEALKALYGLSRRGQALEKQLDSDSAKGTPLQKLPPFPDMVAYVAARSTTMRYTQGNVTLPFSPTTYTEMLMYLRMCLAQSAGVPITREVSQHPTEHSPLIGRYLRQLDRSDVIDRYLGLAQKLLVANVGIGSIACMLEAVGTVPDALAPKLVEKLPWLKGLLASTKEDIRETASLLYGAVVAYGLSEHAYQQTLTELLTLTGNKTLETQHGAILALAHVLERKISRLKAGGGGAVQGVARFEEAVQNIVSFLGHQHALLITAACSAVGELARRTALPLTDEGKLALVNKLVDIVNNNKLNTKVKERAAKAAGLLCVGEDFKYSREIVDSFLGMAKDTKDVEVHFTLGEALVCCVQGVQSPEARDAWTTLESEYGAPEMSGPPRGDLEYVLDQLLGKYAREPHPNSRQASCIWLLALLKHCAQHAAIKQRLELMQTTFMDLLSENSDIVQDVASKGLALVYESSDEELRQKLVAELLDQLTSGRRKVAQVTEDTKLFEEGALGKTPSGGNLSTYKELCSLASDLNQPDLIYKFMHLANHNAIWNSKKGAAFGFFSIASSAGEQLAQHLPKIVPRLYRYQFDPTPRIQNSMMSIWHALVPETQKTIELYHKEIFADLISNLTAGQWRVRISCCLALSDFMRSAAGNTALRDCCDRLPELWTQLFRVMDDVHEGTRTAAGNTTRVLSKLCVRMCDVTNGKAGEEMVKTILPVILNVGITNTVAEVRAVSLETMSKLTAAAGALLRPHLPVLIPALLEATGELESRGLSHLSVRYGAEQQAQEVIDAVRASAAKSHYTMETVVKCLPYLDASVLAELIPRVLDLMKSSVGLGTRVACAHLVVLLVSHLKLELQPYSGKMMNALVNGLTDRNAAIRKNYSSAIGHLVTAAKDSTIEKLFTKLRSWYIEKEDETVRSACAFTLQAIGVHSQEVLKDHAQIVAPLVFFAMHGNKSPDGNSIEVWEEVWQEVTPGTESGIKHHIADICELLQMALESPSWTMKAQAANSVSTVATKVGPALTVEHRTSLVNILVSGLNGRTWHGKEHLLHALATLCSSCKETLRGEETLVNAIVEAVLKECRKDQVVYKRHSLQALGDILSALEVDKFDQVYAIGHATLDKGTTDGNDSDDEGAGGRSRESLLELKETVYETLGKSWPSDPLTQVRYREQLLDQCVSCLANSTRPVQVAVVAALRCYVDKLCLLDATPESSNPDDEKALERILTQIREAITFSLGISKHTRLRKEALNVLYLLGKRLKASGRSEQLLAIASSLEPALEDVARDNTPEIKSRLVDIKDLLRT